MQAVIRMHTGRQVKAPDPYTPNAETSADHLLMPEVERTHDADTEQESTSRSKLGAILYEIVETILLAVVIWLVVNFATARYVVEGQSMEANLHTGQFLIVSRLSYLRIRNWIELGEPQRGDIVVFDFPGNPGDDYVKRVIGLPGEKVTIDEEGRVYIKDVLLDEPYLTQSNVEPYRGRFGTWIVPEDSYFVLGDNRNSSSDSRSWGMLESKYIVGKAWLSYWPPRYWGVIPHYEYTEPQAMKGRPEQVTVFSPAG